MGEPRYEVTFFLEADETSAEAMRRRWDEIGDSVVVVGSGTSWSCHIHTNALGDAIEAGIEAGRPSSLRVADLREEPPDPVHHRPQPFNPLPEASMAPVGVVAVAAGEGLVELFRRLGCQGIVAGGSSLVPSAGAMLEVVEGVPAPLVVLLPNAAAAIPLAEQVAAISAKEVEVVPTRNLQQGIAAMLGYSFAGDDLERAAEDMAAAASAIVSGEVTRALRDARADFGQVRRGEWLGVADGTVVVADPDPAVALRGLVAAVLPSFGVEQVTVYTGEEAMPAVTKSLEAWLGEIHPHVVLRAIEGGQPRYPYLVAVE